MNDYGYLREEYPPILSSEQVRKILHISKRKCAEMLHNGVIPCVDTNKKTRRYFITLDDVIAYINSSEESQNAVKPKQPPSDFRDKLADEWYNVPDVLTITDVATITGYSANAVDRWIVKGSLRSAIVQTGLITCREWLIDFYCNDGYNIVKKVEKHIRLINKLSE